MVAGASISVVSAPDGSLCSCPTTSLIAWRVVAHAPRSAIPSSSPGGNCTVSPLANSPVTVGVRLVNASITPSGLLRSALKTPEIAVGSALPAMFVRFAAVSVSRVDQASTSWTGRVCTLGSGATVSGVTAITLAPTRATPAVAYGRRAYCMAGISLVNTAL